LPQGYEVPKGSGDYMKLKQGANKFRILSAPILGYEYWTAPKAGEQYGKPVRSRELPKVIPVDADISKGWNPKHFWAMVVWNFEDRAVQILQLSQKSIQQSLTELIHNEEWGDPRGYTITITRKGEMLDTEYSVVPSPKADVPAEITRMYEEKNVDLDALYDGGNPFDATDRNPATDAKTFPTTATEARQASGDDIPF
jgi:hypothetical protein